MLGLKFMWTQKTSPISGRATWLKYHIEHFGILDVRLLTLTRPLRADVHGGFHSIRIDPMVALSFFGGFTHLSVFGGVP
jgi:hypothetical protein